MSDTKKQISPILGKTTLTWLPRKTFELEFIIPWIKVKNSYGKILKQVAEDTTIKGFRKGKAPMELVEKNLDKSKIYEKVIQDLLPETYEAVVKKHNLRPIVSPKVKVIKAAENEDWMFKAQACEAPEISLGNYEQLIRGEMAKTKIWTPDKGKENLKTNQTTNQNQKINTVTQLLLKNIKIEVPDMLIEEELNRLLTNLLDQVNALGMTIDQYLSTKGLNKDQVRQDLSRQAEETLKLEFILQAIVKNKNITSSEKEILEIINKNPDDKTKKQLDQPLQKAYLASILNKRKALDYLINL